MFDIPLNYIVAFLFGVLAIYILVRLLYFPARVFLKVAGNMVIGGLLLVIFNVLGGLWGIYIGINVFTAAIAGFFGAPGIVMLLVLQMISA